MITYVSSTEDLPKTKLSQHFKCLNSYGISCFLQSIIILEPVQNRRGGVFAFHLANPQRTEFKRWVSSTVEIKRCNA